MLWRARRYDMNGNSKWTFDPVTGKGMSRLGTDPSTWRKEDQFGGSWLEGLKGLKGGVTVPLKGFIKGIEGQRVELDTQTVALDATLEKPRADDVAKGVISATTKVTEKAV